MLEILLRQKEEESNIYIMLVSLSTLLTWLHFLGEWFSQFVHQGFDGEEFGWITIMRRPLKQMELATAAAQVYHHTVVTLHYPSKTQTHKFNAIVTMSTDRQEKSRLNQSSKSCANRETEEPHKQTLIYIHVAGFFRHRIQPYNIVHRTKPF